MGGRGRTGFVPPFFSKRPAYVGTTHFHQRDVHDKITTSPTDKLEDLRFHHRAAPNEPSLSTPYNFCAKAATPSEFTLIPAADMATKPIAAVTNCPGWLSALLGGSPD